MDEELEKLSVLGKEELRKKYNAFLNGDKNYGIPWEFVKMMRDKNYISQEEINYIVK